MKKRNVTKVFFQDFTEQEISEVIKNSEVITCKKNSVLFNEGDKSHSFYIISTGELEIFSIDENGEEINIAAVRSGSVVGEVGFLDGQSRTASARALSDVIALAISNHAFSKLEEIDIMIAIKVIREIETILAERLRFTDKLLVDYHTAKVDQKFLEKLNIKNN